MLKFGVGFAIGMATFGALLDFIAADDELWKEWTDKVNDNHRRKADTSVSLSVDSRPIAEAVEKARRSASYMGRA